MNPIKCPNCGNYLGGNWSNYDGEYDGYYYDPIDACYYEGERMVEESNPYLTCDKCGKRYVNPYYVEKKSADITATENTSSDSDKGEHTDTVLRCVSCNGPLRRNDSLPILTCDLCRKEHKNPYYKPSQPANAKENTTNRGDFITPKTSNTNNVGEKKTKASAMSKVVFAIKKALSRHFPTRITIPQGVTNIGDRAFYRCNGLTSVVIPDGVTSIGDESFFCCRKLKNIVIPDGVTSIGYEAFSCCRKLKNIVIPDSVTSIDCRAFEVCCSLTSIVIPDSVTSIGDHAFYECSSLTSITIPDSVTSIGEGAFASCNSLTSITVASDNPVYHSAGNCLIETATGTLIAACKNSVIPTDGSVTNIGDCAFYGCRSLPLIIIPDSVTRIGSRAFIGCKSIVHITIPDSVTSIGYSAFGGCDKLTRVYFNDPKGWYARSRETDDIYKSLDDAGYNARYFRDTYRDYSWGKE